MTTSMLKDVYEINDSLIATLNEENKIIRISKMFNEAQRNCEKVKFMESLLLEYNCIPNLEIRKPKYNEESTKLRTFGNIFFKNKNYFVALENYNKSICFAENKSDNLAMAFGNRSAVYFELKLFNECLKNIELARKFDYPERLANKLDQRELACKNAIKSKKNKSQKSVYVPKLSHPANPTIPFIIDGLLMKEIKGQGRSIITEKELKPGEIIAVESAFMNVLLPNFRYQRCSYCMIENNLNLIPCPNCTNAMFCNENCLSKAQEEFHEMECPIIDFLFTLFNKIHLNAIRTSIKAVTSFGSMDKLMKFVEEVDESKINVFSKDHSKKITDAETYELIHTLSTNQSCRNTADLFQRGTIAAMAYHILMKHTKLISILEAENHQNLFMELLFRHLQIAPTNFHSLDTLRSAKNDESYCCGAYPFASLINHGCAPNISRFSYGNKIVIFALRVIKKGQELLDNYGYHHCTHMKSDRQTQLKFQYNFICACEACRKDYNLLFHIPINPSIRSINTERDFEELMSLNWKFVKDNMQKYCNYLTKNDNFYPCLQLCEIQENLKLSYQIISDNIMFHTKCDRLTQSDFNSN